MPINGSTYKRRSRRVAGLAGSVWAIPLLALATPAIAQVAAPITVTPPTLVPQKQDNGFRVEIPETGALTAPRGAEGLTATLGSVSVEGGFPELAAQTAQIVQGLEGRQVTLAEIYAAASAIEAAHARAGFVLARVSVPAQDLRNGGPLRIVVTDGFIETIDVSHLPGHVRHAVWARVAALQGQRHLRFHDIEQALLIANDTPGLTLRSTLLRGGQPGGTVLLLEGNAQLVSGSIGAENQYDPSLSTWGINAQLSLNSLLGLGEQFDGFVASGYDLSKAFSNSSPVSVGGGGVTLPIGDGRLSLNPEVTYARTSPSAPAGSPQTVGLLRRLTLRANYTLEKPASTAPASASRSNNWTQPTRFRPLPPPSATIATWRPGWG